MNAAAWLTLRDAAARLGVTCYRMNRVAARGTVRARVSPLSGQLQFNLEDIDRLAAELAAG
jgi:hypothetical protein